MTRILIKGEGAPPTEWDLKTGTVNIGRKSENDLCLDDPTVSGHHAKIVTYFQSSHIEDLNSTNGTFVNGRRVRMHTLHAGDIISLGKFELLFGVDAKQPAHPPATDSDTTAFPQAGALSLEAGLEPPPAPIDPEPEPESRAEPGDADYQAYFQVMAGERAGQRVPILDDGLELSPGVRVLRHGDQFVVSRSEALPKGVVRLNSRELDPAGAPLRDMDMLQVDSVWMAFFSA